MNNQEEDCYFLCFNKCQNTPQPINNTNNNAPINSFQKLSLKKLKEEHHIQHTKSFKKIERPIPTTERSAEENT